MLSSDHCRVGPSTDCVVCSRDTYAKSLPEALRVPAMRWLKVHAEYDDTHPWEALDIANASTLGFDDLDAA